MRRVVLEFNGTETEYQCFIENVKNNSNVVFIEDSLIDNHVITVNELRIDSDKRQVMYKTEPINLTAREFDILYFMASHPGQAFSHQQIYEAVWKHDYYQDVANITAHIGHIRKKIEPNPRCPVYIQTVHGVGYKFTER